MVFNDKKDIDPTYYSMLPHMVNFNNFMDVKCRYDQRRKEIFINTKYYQYYQYFKPVVEDVTAKQILPSLHNNWLQATRELIINICIIVWSLRV